MFLWKILIWENSVVRLVVRNLCLRLNSLGADHHIVPSFKLFWSLSPFWLLFNSSVVYISRPSCLTVETRSTSQHVSSTGVISFLFQSMVLPTLLFKTCSLERVSDYCVFFHCGMLFWNYTSGVLRIWSSGFLKFMIHFTIARSSFLVRHYFYSALPGVLLK